MKKLYFFGLASVLAFTSCSEKDYFDQDAVDARDNQGVLIDVELGEVATYKMTQEYTVPVKAGKVSVLTYGKDTLAITDRPVTLNIPKMLNSSVAKVVTRSGDSLNTEEAAIDKIVLEYRDAAELTNYKPGTTLTNEETVLMFEDDPKCDYDYNDVVLLVKCRTLSEGENTLVNIAVKPLACSAANNIKFGFDYEYTEQDTTTADSKVIKTVDTKGIVLSNNVRKDFFNSSNGNINTQQNYSPIIPLKDYKLDTTFGYTNRQSNDSMPAIVKFDRKSYIETDTIKVGEKDSIAKDTIKIDNEGFYQLAPIEFTGAFDVSKIKFYIAPEVELSYVKTTTTEVNGTKLTGKIRFSSIFTYKLYAGDCNLKSNSLVPLGISIPVKMLKNPNDSTPENTHLYWPYERMPIWAGLTKFNEWLSEDNDGSWINEINETASFTASGLKWDAKLLVQGASVAQMKFNDIVNCKKDYDEMKKYKKKASDISVTEKKVTEKVVEATKEQEQE